MRKINWIKRVGLGLITFLTVFTLHAATQTKFTFEPTTPTTIHLAVNETKIIQYRVTNQTAKTRTLTMVPIKGIIPIHPKAGMCSNPFTLAPEQFCLLTLKLDGSKLAAKVTSGPEVCKTKGPGDNSPSSFLCSQPGPNAQLNMAHYGFRGLANCTDFIETSALNLIDR